MRQVLIDDSRRDLAQKRGGLRVHTTWMDERGMPETAGALAQDDGVDLERLDAAMRDLSTLSPARAHVVELRFFAGLTLSETALAMAVSDSTVKRQWRAAGACVRGHNVRPRSATA